MDGEAKVPFEASKYNDDRIGRCLDDLFDSDRDSMQAEAAAAAIKVHELECEYIHNDTTTVTFSGAYENPEAGAVVPAHGYNKDHRADLKQVVFGLNTTADGHIPVGYHLYDGNQADVTTHAPNWEGIRELLGKADFIYIADSKLCDMKTLELIAGNGGRFITIMPANRKEVIDFI
jgi:transposase